MGLISEVRGRARYALGPLFGILLLSYFAYHLVQGERGLSTWMQLRQTVETVKVEHRHARSIRAMWEHRVSLLRPESLDPDMLEERARLMLNYGRPGDIVIPLR